MMRIGTPITSLSRAVASRVVNIGRLPVCNQDAGHAPRIGRFCFPLCWRCLSILLGLLAVSFVLPLVISARIHPVVPVLLSIPCLVDSLSQRWLHVESTTYRRIATGFLTGAAIAIL